MWVKENSTLDEISIMAKVIMVQVGDGPDVLSW